jgi:hypothetical protein
MQQASILDYFSLKSLKRIGKGVKSAFGDLEINEQRAPQKFLLTIAKRYGCY